jgi:succinate dehydrogenase / fumarate reductase cytochrome b subunit
MSHAAAVASAPARSGFESSRLGSLLAFLPLGVWTVNHLWNNLAAFDGAAAWQHSVTEYPHPLAQVATTIVVMLPLVWHAVWGIKRLRTSKVNLGQYSYFANLKYVVQRLSALGLLLFLGAHVWLAFLHPHLVEGHAEPFSVIASEMRHNAPTLPVYALGVLAVSYHFANGLSSLAMGWGVVSTRGALKRLDVLVWAVFLLMLAMGWGSIYALWNAGGSLPVPAH